MENIRVRANTALCERIDCETRRIKEPEREHPHQYPQEESSKKNLRIQSIIQPPSRTNRRYVWMRGESIPNEGIFPMRRTR